MNHLGFEMEKVKIGSFDFTCCEGCQLQLANKESTLPDFLALLDIRNFREISSERLDDYDIALVEGSPDLLAGFHLAWCAGAENDIAVVAMLGASNRIPDVTLQHFAGKHVRIFADADVRVQEAGQTWARQLAGAGVPVSGYSFAGLVQSDGSPVKDLNDFAHVCPDTWEGERDSIEEAFAFAPQARTAAFPAAA